jgi:DNA-binding response OmpR family regulator
MEKIVLIIDDDPDYSAALKAVIESKGYQADTAPNSETGLKKIEIRKPDLIILDVMMETKDEGFRFSRKLKKSEAYKAIPILMLTSMKETTGFDFKSEVGDDKWLPVNDYCDKLIKMDELLVKIEELLQA